MSYIATCRYQAAGFRTGSRTTRRSFVHMPATIKYPAEAGEEHVAFVRDISPRGIFFYSKLKPEPGKRIDFMLQCASKVTAVGLHLSGITRRVEEAPGGAVGVAIEFDTCHDDVPRSPLRAKESHCP